MGFHSRSRPRSGARRRGRSWRAGVLMSWWWPRTASCCRPRYLHSRHWVASTSTHPFSRAGAAPVERAILAGDPYTGITIMQMDAGLDTGPVLLQRRIEITREHTGGSLRAELAALGAETLLDVLTELTAGTLTARPQP